MMIATQECKETYGHPAVVPTCTIRLEIPGLETQTLALADGRYAIGTGARCQLPLALPGIAPLHATLFVRDSEVHITRWAGSALLNGEEFFDAPLALGDQLVLGAATLIRIEDSPESKPLVGESLSPRGLGQSPRGSQARRAWTLRGSEETSCDFDATPSNGREWPSEIRFSVGGVPRRGGSDAQASRSVRASKAQTLRIASARRRSRRLIAALREAQEAVAELQARVDATESRCQEAEQRVAQSQAELLERHRASAEATELASRVAELQSQVDERDRQLRLRVEQLALLQEGIPNDYPQLSLELADAREQIATLEALRQVAEDQLGEIQSQAAELAAREAQLQQAREEAAALAAEKETSESRLAELASQASQQQTELANVLADLERVSRERTELTESAAQQERRAEVSASELEEARGEIERLRAELADAMSQQSGHDFRESLALENEALTEQAAIFEADLIGLQQQIAAYETEEAKLRSELAALADQNQMLEERTSQAELRESDLVAQRDEAVRNASQPHIEQNEWDALNEELARRDAQLQEVTIQLTACQQELERLEADYRSAATRLAEVEQAASAANAAEPVPEPLALDFAEPDQEPDQEPNQEPNQESALTPEQETAPAITDGWALDQGSAKEGLPTQFDLSDGWRSAETLLVEHEPAHLSDAPLDSLLSAERTAEVPADPQAENAEDTEDQSGDSDRLVDSETVLQEPEQAPAEPAAPFEATSFIDRYEHLLPQDDDHELASERLGDDMLGNEFASRRAPVAQPTDLSDDDALESYMASLMQRVRGDDGPTLGANRGVAAKPCPAASQSPPPPQSKTPVPAPEKVPDEPFDPIDLETLKKSTRKVALSADLSTLRELANSTTRGAIAKHRKKTHYDAIFSRLGIAAITLGVGGYMAAVSQVITEPKFMAGCGIAMVGLVVGVQALVLMLQALADRPEREPQQPASPETAALPIDGVAESVS